MFGIVTGWLVNKGKDQKKPKQKQKEKHTQRHVHYINNVVANDRQIDRKGIQNQQDPSFSLATSSHSHKISTPTNLAIASDSLIYLFGMSLRFLFLFLYIIIIIVIMTLSFRFVSCVLSIYRVTFSYICISISSVFIHLFRLGFHLLNQFLF